jgi:alginate production protein
LRQRFTLALCFCLVAQGAYAREAPVATDEGDAEGALRQRLTEREDKRRPLEPFTLDLAGRPLVLGGEIEIETDWLRLRERSGARTVLQLETEAFYSFGKSLSLFAQLHWATEKDLRREDYPLASGRFVERGEMWLYSEDIGGSGINIDVGRLQFEDERRWWWDEELDAVRIEYEAQRFDVALAYAREMAPRRLDRHYIDPEHERVRRWLLEASFDWRPNHALELFALRHDDRSHAEMPGQTVDRGREDEADARLTWLGARMMGGLELSGGSTLGYWLDLARVRGRERIAEYEEIAAQHSQVVAVDQQHVRGWALDVGFNWLLPMAYEPRLYAGYAVGSGGARSGNGSDTAFRQTGLQANEAGFGGVERFVHYGMLLDPELANLQVLTLGTGISLLHSSSLDLIYHRYRLYRPANVLRDDRLDLELDGTRRKLGHAFDMVLALEEWQRFELLVIVSAYRRGAAVVARPGQWDYGAVLALRVLF